MAAMPNILKFVLLTATTLLERAEAAPQLVDLCDSQIFATIDDQNAQQYREYTITTCNRRLVAYVFPILSDVQIFDGTFETGQNLSVPALEPIPATGRMLSIRGTFSTDTQVVVSDRFIDDKDHLCGGVILVNQKDDETYAQPIDTGCVSVFTGQWFRLRVPRDMDIFQGYTFMKPYGILQPYIDGDGVYVVNAFLSLNSAVLVTTANFTAPPNIIEVCKRDDCQRMHISKTTPVQPFYVGPAGSSMGNIQVVVDAGLLATFNVLQPIAQDTTYDLCNVTEQDAVQCYSPPDKNNFECAMNAPFIFHYQMNNDNQGIYGRMELTDSTTPICREGVTTAPIKTTQPNLISSTSAINNVTPTKPTNVPQSTVTKGPLPTNVPQSTVTKGPLPTVPPVTVTKNPAQPTVSTTASAVETSTKASSKTQIFFGSVISALLCIMISY